MRVLTKLIRSINLNRKIQRNLILIGLMSVVFVSLLARSAWTSEIILPFPCHGYQIMPAGGIGGSIGAYCEGAALCYSIDDHIGLISAFCNENAFCPLAEVANDVNVDTTSTNLRCRGIGANLWSGRIVHSFISTEGCDPGDNGTTFRFPQFENCAFLPADIPGLPPNVLF